MFDSDDEHKLDQICKKYKVHKQAQTKILKLLEKVEDEAMQRGASDIHSDDSWSGGQDYHD